MSRNPKRENDAGAGAQKEDRRPSREPPRRIPGYDKKVDGPDRPAE